MVFVLYCAKNKKNTFYYPSSSGCMKAIQFADKFKMLQQE